MSSATQAPGAVAVVIPCYNAAATIAQTLASAIGQPGVSEIIAVDDGSSDETLAILRRHLPNIRVESQANAGVSTARNRGIALTTAPWLLFLDADDQLMPGTVAHRLEAVGDAERDVIICPWREQVDHGEGKTSLGDVRRVDWELLERDAEIACATRVWATTAAILYPRPLLERCGGFRADLPVIQDARLLFDAAAHGARFRRLDTPGAIYRVVPGSLSRRHPAAFWLDVLRNGEQIEQIWRAKGKLDAERRAALGEIFDGATNALLRLGHPSASCARAARRRYLPSEPGKMRGGFAAMSLLGGRAVGTAFRLAQRMSPAQAIPTR